MVVSSNGALGTLQELGGLATSRLQGLIGSTSGLAELLGTSKITSSPPVKALADIGGVVVGRVIERATTGKELEALKDIGGVMLNRLVTTVQEVAGQMGDGAGPGLQARFQELSGLAMSVAESTGLADGFTRLAETAMGVIGKSRS
jgi:hypothetical protein